MGMILGTIRDEPGWLRIVATGEFSLEDAERTFLEMLDAVAQHNAEKVLLDGRELTGEPATIHRFLYGAFAADSVATYIAARHVPSTLRFAYALREPVLDPHRFGETVAVNRGMWVRAFDSFEEALEWLKLSSVNEPDSADNDDRR
jgi:hypothetical protein